MESVFSSNRDTSMLEILSRHQLYFYCISGKMSLWPIYAQRIAIIAKVFQAEWKLMQNGTKMPGNYQKNGRKWFFRYCATKEICYNRGFLALRRQRKLEFSNRHKPISTVYFVPALKPSTLTSMVGMSWPWKTVTLLRVIINVQSPDVFWSGVPMTKV